MANTYKRMDYDQLLFYTNYLLQKLKASPLANDTKYTLERTEDDTSIVLKDNTGKVISTITDKDTIYGKVTSAVDGLMIAADKAKLDAIAAGAQVNVLEGVKVNGDALTPSNKSVNITIVKGTANGTIKVNGTEIAVAGLGTAAFQSVDAFDKKGAATAVLGNAEDTATSKTVYGAIAKTSAVETRVTALETAVGDGGTVDDKIIAAIGGLDSSIPVTQHEAIAGFEIADGKITKPQKVAIPTDNASLANGAGYQTASDVANAIANKANKATTLAGYGITDAYTKNDTNTAIANAIAKVTQFEFKVVEALPETGEKGFVYLVAHTHGTNDKYDEYIWVSNAFEKIGNTDIDLSNYVQRNEMQTLSNAEITNAVDSAFAEIFK